MKSLQPSRRSFLRLMSAAAACPIISKSLTAQPSQGQNTSTHHVKKGALTMRLAGIEVIDSQLVKDSMDLAQAQCSPYLFNHVMRSWLISTLTASKLEVKPDPEVLAVAVILHDLGLAKTYEAANRFEVDGANAARSFLQSRGVNAHNQQLVWDAIALHTTASIASHKEPEVAMCAAGIGCDIAGFNIDKFPPQQIAAINAAYPRLAIKEQFKNDMCAIVRSKPQTTYDNFVRDFVERYVPGYKAPSAADRLQNALYAE